MSRFRALLIPVDVNAPIEERSIEVGEDRVGDQLHFLQELVGGYVERVASRDLLYLAGQVAHDTGNAPVGYRQGPALLVNEEGLLKALERNDRASVFYPINLGLHGPAVLIWEAGEDWVSVPDWFTVTRLANEIDCLR